MTLANWLSAWGANLGDDPVNDAIFEIDYDAIADARRTQRRHSGLSLQEYFVVIEGFRPDFAREVAADVERSWRER